jgi:hypothetical protein
MWKVWIFVTGLGILDKRGWRGSEAGFGNIDFGDFREGIYLGIGFEVSLVLFLEFEFSLICIFDSWFSKFSYSSFLLIVFWIRCWPSPSSFLPLFFRFKFPSFSI